MDDPRARWAAAWRAVRLLQRGGSESLEAAMILQADRLMGGAAILLQHQSDALARRRPWHVLGLHRRRCHVCGRLRTDLRWQSREHADDCDEIPF